MTMTDDLVKRMRSEGLCWSVAEVADRIEALTAQLAENADVRTQVDALTADNILLRKLLTEAAADLTAYVNAEYPRDTCAEYPHIAKRHYRDMELVRHIEAALNTGKEVMPDGTSKVPNNDIGPGDQAVAGAAEDFETEIIDNWIKRNEPAVPLVSADAILHGLGLMRDGKHIPVREFYSAPPAWTEGLFHLTGDTLGLRCATDGCGRHVSIRLERDGVGSDYCEPCGLKAARKGADQ